MEEVGSKLHLCGCPQKDLEKFHEVGSGGHWVWSLHFLLPKCRQYSREHNHIDHKVSSALVSQQKAKYCFGHFKFKIDNAVMKPYWHLTSFQSQKGRHRRHQTSFLMGPY
jgi:hypothetical protein